MHFSLPKTRCNIIQGKLCINSWPCAHNTVNYKWNICIGQSKTSNRMVQRFELARAVTIRINNQLRGATVIPIYLWYPNHCFYIAASGNKFSSERRKLHTKNMPENKQAPKRLLFGAPTKTFIFFALFFCVLHKQAKLKCVCVRNILKIAIIFNIIRYFSRFFFPLLREHHQFCSCTNNWENIYNEPGTQTHFTCYFKS